MRKHSAKAVSSGIIRKLNSAKENESSNTPNGGTAVLTSFSLILRFKSVQVRNEIMRLKILKERLRWKNVKIFEKSHFFFFFLNDIKFYQKNGETMRSIKKNFFPPQIDNFLMS